jgi:hypothetical protein
MKYVTVNEQKRRAKLCIYKGKKKVLRVLNNSLSSFNIILKKGFTSNELILMEAVFLSQIILFLGIGALFIDHSTLILVCTLVYGVTKAVVKGKVLLEIKKHSGVKSMVENPLLKGMILVYQLFEGIASCSFIVGDFTPKSFWQYDENLSAAENARRLDNWRLMHVQPNNVPESVCKYNIKFTLRENRFNLKQALKYLEALSRVERERETHIRRNLPREVIETDPAPSNSPIDIDLYRSEGRLTTPTRQVLETGVEETKSAEPDGGFEETKNNDPDL